MELIRVFIFVGLAILLSYTLVPTKSDGDEIYLKPLKTQLVLFVLLLYVPSQELWSLRDGQFT